MSRKFDLRDAIEYLVDPGTVEQSHESRVTYLRRRGLSEGDIELVSDLANAKSPVNSTMKVFGKDVDINIEMPSLSLGVVAGISVACVVGGLYFIRKGPSMRYLRRLGKALLNEDDEDHDQNEMQNMNLEESTEGEGEAISAETVDVVEREREREKERVDIEVGYRELNSGLTNTVSTLHEVIDSFREMTRHMEALIGKTVSIAAVSAPPPAPVVPAPSSATAAPFPILIPQPQPTPTNAAATATAAVTPKRNEESVSVFGAPNVRAGQTSQGVDSAALLLSGVPVQSFNSLPMSSPTARLSLPGWKAAVSQSQRRNHNQNQNGSEVSESHSRPQPQSQSVPRSNIYQQRHHVRLRTPEQEQVKVVIPSSGDRDRRHGRGRGGQSSSSVSRAASEPIGVGGLWTPLTDYVNTISDPVQRQRQSNKPSNPYELGDDEEEDEDSCVE